MQEMADWLKALGLPEYARAFRRTASTSRSFPILPIRISRTSAFCSGIAGKYWQPSLSSSESRRQNTSLFLR